MSTITRERIANLIEFNSEGSDCQANAEQWEVHELARIALASLEAEAVAWTTGRYSQNIGYKFGEKEPDEAPCIMSIYWDFDTFRAHTDCDATALRWLEEAIKNTGAKPLYTAPPGPVSVPDYPETLPCPVMLEPGLRFGKGVQTNAMLGALQRRSEYYAELDAMTPEQRAHHEVGMKEFAAMLQGAEPVTTAYKLPFEQWLSQQTGTIDVECGCVMTEVFFHWLRVAYEAGNSPVIPDGWVACSERMPVDFETVLVCQDGGVIFCAEYEDGDFYPDEFPNVPKQGCEITHWMPLPAAPQQEVK